MNESLTISLLFFIAGISMLLLRKKSNGILGALMGYGTWKLKTPQHFEAGYKIAGISSITYSIVNLFLYYFFPEFMRHLVFGMPTSIFILLLFSVLLFPLVSFTLEKINI